MKLIQKLFCILCMNLAAVSHASTAVSNLVDPAKYVLRNEKQLIDLSNSLSLYNVAGLVGVSGMGKTELARIYAYKNQDKYDLVWFFDCNSDLAEQFVTLSKQINKSQLCGSNECDLSEETDKAKREVLSFLAPKSNWLLVFDNLHVNQNAKINDILDWAHNGHVMICSQDAKDLPNSVNLPYLSDEDSANLVDTILEEKNPQLVVELVQAFKGYPILIAQGAMFLNKNKHMTVAEYKKILARSDDKMHSHIEVVLKQLPHSAKRLLYKIAVLNNQSFSRKLLETISSDSDTLLKDLNYVTRFGLINLTSRHNDKQTFEMHDAVKAALLKTMGPKEAKNTVVAVIDCINELMPKGESQMYMVFDGDKTLKSNMEALLSNAQKYEANIYKNMELRKNLLSAYLGLFDYYNCQKMTDWLLENQDRFDSILASIMMSDKEKTIYSEYLAIVGTYSDYAKSDFITATKYLKKALDLVKESKNHRELTCNIYYDLAQVYVYGGDIKNTENILKIIDSIPSNNPKTDLEVWFTKAKLHLIRGNYIEAQYAIDKYFETSNYIPNDSIYKAPGYILQAEILNYMGEFQEAYNVSLKTYQQQKINIKGDHEMHSRILVQLAWSELGLGLKQEAFGHIKEALRIQENTDELIGDNIYANSYDVDLASAYVVHGNILSAMGSDTKTIMDSYGKARVIYYNRYYDNTFRVDDIKRFYLDAAQNLCRMSDDKEPMVKVMYTEFRDKLVEYWNEDQKTKEIVELEKKHNCRILPTRQAIFSSSLMVH